MTPGSHLDTCGNELAVLEHPNQEKYPGQRIAMVQVDD